MNTNYFSDGFLDAHLEKRRMMHKIRAAHRVLQQSTYSLDSARADLQALEEKQLPRDEDAFSKPTQAHTDEQQVLDQDIQLGTQAQ
ncbi:MAG: hypothetical protein DYH15_14560 [Nitrosomonas sp. PRO4]|nr:hypothetical protein [Nitrosomonas sp. PRO4]